MKPLSFRGVAVATLLLLACISFSSGKDACPPEKGNSTLTSANYHYYLASGDVYDGYYTVAQEISRLEVMYNVFVDTNPLGGTLLARGYTVFGVPHMIWPASLLYGHF